MVAVIEKPVVAKKQVVKVLMPKVVKGGESIEERRLALWEGCIKAGWERIPQPVGMNCLYKPESKNKVRLNFLADVLRMEEKSTLTEKERKDTHRNAKWVMINQSPYEKAELAEGGLVFNKE